MWTKKIRMALAAGLLGVSAVPATAFADSPRSHGDEHGRRHGEWRRGDERRDEAYRREEWRRDEARREEWRREEARREWWRRHQQRGGGWFVWFGL